jgi:predicted ribosome quality control (RQC) complex YloA/Tae2 family protein
MLVGLVSLKCISILEIQRGKSFYTSLKGYSYLEVNAKLDNYEADAYFKEIDVSNATIVEELIQENEDLKYKLEEMMKDMNRLKQDQKQLEQACNLINYLWLIMIMVMIFVYKIHN